MPTRPIPDAARAIEEMADQIKLLAARLDRIAALAEKLLTRS